MRLGLSQRRHIKRETSWWARIPRSENIMTVVVPLNRENVSRDMQGMQTKLLSFSRARFHPGMGMMNARRHTKTRKTASGTRPRCSEHTVLQTRMLCVLHSERTRASKWRMSTISGRNTCGRTGMANDFWRTGARREYSATCFMNRKRNTTDCSSRWVTVPYGARRAVALVGCTPAPLTRT